MAVFRGIAAAVAGAVHWVWPMRYIGPNRNLDKLTAEQQFEYLKTHGRSDA